MTRPSRTAPASDRKPGPRSADGLDTGPDLAPSMASTPDPAGAWSLATTTAPDLALGRLAPWSLRQGCGRGPVRVPGFTRRFRDGFHKGPWVRSAG